MRSYPTIPIELSIHHWVQIVFHSCPAEKFCISMYPKALPKNYRCSLTTTIDVYAQFSRSDENRVEDTYSCMHISGKRQM